MSLLRAGSWPWLLRHEMRLAWRRLSSNDGTRKRGRRWWIFVWATLAGVVWLAFHGFAYLLLRHIDTAALPALVQLFLGAGAWFLFTLMLSHTILMAVDVLFDRGDFDLLLASPLPARTVFIVRGLGVALTTPLLYLALLSPLADAGPFAGNGNLLAIYPTLLALGLLATAIGMVLTLGLVRWLGARRARVAAQLLGAFVGAAMFLLSQAGNFFGRIDIDWRALVRQANDDDGWLAAASPVWLPLHAALGQPVALAVLCLGSLLAFAAVIRLTAQRFLAGTQETAVVEAALPAERAGNRRLRFRGGLIPVVLLKEWRLLWRDPQLIAQTLLQTLYLLPIVFAWGRNGSRAALLVPATVVAATSLASGLSWLTVAAEDAPELVASAPVGLGKVRLIKLLAALLPVWVLLLPLMALVGDNEPWTMAVYAFGLLGATFSAGLIHLNLSKPGDRKNLRRRGKGNLLAGILEVLNTIGWGGLVALLLVAPVFAVFPALFAIGVPLAAVIIGRRRRARGDDS